MDWGTPGFATVIRVILHVGRRSEGYMVEFSQH